MPHALVRRRVPRSRLSWPTGFLQKLRKLNNKAAGIGGGSEDGWRLGRHSTRLKWVAASKSQVLDGLHRSDFSGPWCSAGDRAQKKGPQISQNKLGSFPSVLSLPLRKSPMQVRVGIPG